LSHPVAIFFEQELSLWSVELPVAWLRRRSPA